MENERLSDAACVRWGLLAEAVFPVVAAQTYIWALPHERPRWLDAVFAVAVGVVLVVLTVRRGLVGWRLFGLAWGRDHVRAALPVAAFTLAAIGLLLAWGWFGVGLRRDWDIVTALLAYPIWGLVQEALVFAFVYPRLRLLAGVRAAPVLAAVLFAAAHAPNPLLMAGGAGMVFVYALIWERAPSLPLIGISHGLIGAVCDKALHVSMRVGRHFFEA